MRKPHVLFVLFFFTAAQLCAQKGVAVAAAVDKTAILIGEPLQLTLQATFSNAHALLFFTLDSLPHFEISNRSKIDTQATAGQTVLTQTLTLTSWDSGAWAIPPLSIAGLKNNVTKPLVVTVAYTPMPPNQDYHDIKDIIDVQKPERTTWYWYLVGAALLALIGLLLFPKKKREAVVETPLHEGAYKRALQNLDALQLNTTADDKEYFTELIQIFRTYLQQGKGIHSFQQTTDDLSRQLQRLQLPHGDLKKLVETLQLSDFVKFAQYKVSKNEREQAWTEIKQRITAIEQLQS